MRIQVRKCPFTGQIFEEKDIQKYIDHLHSLRKEFKEERRLNRIRSEFDNWLLKEKQQIIDTNLIVPWILSNQRYLMDAFNKIGIKTFDNKFFKNDVIERLSITYIFGSNVSNSHSCPKNGVENWCARDKSLPTGYPGYRLSISGSLLRDGKHNSSYPMYDFFKMIGLYAGTGGGGNKDFHWDGQLFLADWPGLGQDEVIKRLKGQGV